MREDKALVNRLLPSFTALDQIREAIGRHTEVRDKISTSVDLPLSNECKRVLAYANEESERFGHNIIGCEHLLLGILREQHCFAAQLLNQQAVTLANVREDLEKHGPSPRQPPQPTIGRQTIPFGRPVPALRVRDLGASVNFYKELGFHDLSDGSHLPFRLLTGTAGLLALYSASLGQTLVCFTVGDLTRLRARVDAGELTSEQQASDTSDPFWLLLRDPDENAVLLISPNPRTAEK